jgi:hypothetical protein
MRGCGMKIRRRCEDSCKPAAHSYQPSNASKQCQSERHGSGKGEAVEGDLYLLQQFGPFLDQRIGEQTLRDYLSYRIAENSSQEGWNQAAALNRAQREYSRKCTKQNIVLKARQVGITTYVAARYFLQTITRPGTLTVQVAHSQESAEAIFNIVQRFWENLPKAMLKGALVEVALECPPDRVSAARQRVSSGNGGRQRGAGDDHP